MVRIILPFPHPTPFPFASLPLPLVQLLCPLHLTLTTLAVKDGDNLQLWRLLLVLISASYDVFFSGMK